jgi:hypothetical protein
VLCDEERKCECGEKVTGQPLVVGLVGVRVWAGSLKQYCMSGLSDSSGLLDVNPESTQRMYAVVP